MAVVATKVDSGLTNPPVDLVFEGTLSESKDGSVRPVKMIRARELV